MSISAWLAKLGMERYASAFHDAEVDLATLPFLTDDDLKEMGLPLGPRRKVLSALAAGLPSGASESVESTPERRHLTVMFADLANSTDLSVRIDPEPLSALLESYKAIIANEVSNGAGTVAKYLGDGVLAYFGWPQAREDAAECAIRCALQMVERVKGLTTPDGQPLACRIGVATGLAVVGGLTGSGSAQEDTIAGEVLNLAARLEGVARPGSIVMSGSTHRLVGHMFECEDLGRQSLKGFDRAVHAWRPVREVLHTRRFAATRANRTPLIGRDQELAVLSDRWAKAKQGEGRAVLLLGEAGMGKSRLSEGLLSHISDTPHSFISWQCSAFHSGKALYPVIEYITAAAEILDADPPEARLLKLRALLAAAGMPLDEATPLFADLLAILPSAGYEPPDLLPSQRRTATIGALADWIGRIAETKPLLLLLEDAHWIDATTLDLLGRLVSAIGRSPILAVVTSRAALVVPWATGAQISVIGLDRLSNSECEALVRGFAARGDLTQTTVAQVIDKSDGNPLFLEELSLAAINPSTVGGPTVPDTLQSSLMARLDQLGEAKKVAQTCAVLGRRFAFPLVLAMTGAEPASLEKQLAVLIANDILYPLGRAQEGRFEFKHALVRDAAYESLLFSRRRELHERCARILERDFGEVVFNEPELLAHHFAQAARPEEASRYAERAGDRAAAAVSFVEAIAGYGDALDQATKTTPGLDRDRRELALLLKLGPAHMIIEGPQGARVRDTYSRAQKLGAAVGDSDQVFQAVWGLWLNANVGRKLDVAAARAQELVELGDRSGDDSHQLEALHCRWSSAFFRGEYLKASTDAAHGEVLYSAERHHRLHINFGGHDPGVCACVVQGPALAAQGRFVEGGQAVARGIELADALDHPHSICHALMNATIRGTIARDHAAVRLHGERLLTLATMYNFPPVRALGSYLLRWAESEDGSHAGLAAMRAEVAHATAIAPFPLLFSGLLAEQLLRKGEAEDALALTDQALTFLQPANVGMYLPEIFRLRADSLLRLGDRAAAASQFEQAREVARRQRSPLFEVRALAGILRLSSGEARDFAATALRDLLTSIDSDERWPDRTEAEASLY